jgi:hypothetical protein
MSDSACLTFVVISLVGPGELRRCVAQLSRLQAAVVIVGPDDASLGGDDIRFIRSDASVPIRRALGATAAKTEWVAFIEDTCEIGSQWFDAFQALRGELGCRAWCGPIEIATDLPSRCTAMASLEYGEFAPHRWHRLATGPGSAWLPVRRLAGLCLLYRDDVLATHCSDDGLIEAQVNEGLRAAGEPLAMHKGLAVRYAAADLASARVSSRYDHGRIYGGGLHSKLNWRGRALAAAKCAALPLVMVVRGMAGLPRARRYDPMTLGWVVAFASAWSLGEAVGVLFGRGESLAAWR